MVNQNKPPRLFDGPCEAKTISPCHHHHISPTPPESTCGTSTANMADRYIPEHRRTQFKAKNTFKPDELRRRREEQQVEIRKAKREENLAKRRGIGSGDQRPGASLGAAPDSDDDTAPTESQVCAEPFSTPVFPSLVPHASPAPLPVPRRMRRCRMRFSTAAPPTLRHYHPPTS